MFLFVLCPSFAEEVPLMIAVSVCVYDSKHGSVGVAAGVRCVCVCVCVYNLVCRHSE